MEDADGPPLSKLCFDSHMPRHIAAAVPVLTAPVLIAVVLILSSSLASGQQVASRAAATAVTPVAARPQPKLVRPPQLLAVFIGGMDSDPSPEQLQGQARRGQGNSGLFQLQGDLQHPQIATEYFNWNGTRAGHIRDQRPPHSTAICTRVREHLQAHPRDRVAIVGNSWGGHTALEVARQLHDCPAPLQLDLVLFLDPSSAGRAVKNPAKLPLNVSDGANYFTRNSFVWGKLNDPRMVNVDLADPAQGYFSKGVSPPYDSKFSFPAHVAAEWDDRIHAAIKTRLLDLAAN